MPDADFHRPKAVPLGGFKQVERKADKPSRRVRPVRTRSIWTLRPDTVAEAARAFFWRHRALEALTISIVLSAGFLFVAWCLFAVRMK